MTEQAIWQIAQDVMGHEARLSTTREFEVSGKVTVSVTHPHFRTIEAFYFCQTVDLPGAEEKEQAKVFRCIMSWLQARRTWLEASPGLGSRRPEAVPIESLKRETILGLRKGSDSGA